MKQVTKRELTPRLRFPAFRNGQAWEIQPLRQLLLKHPDYGVDTTSVRYSADIPAYLRITDISDEGYYLPDKKVSIARAVKDDNYLTEGDIVLARTGTRVGISYRYRKEDGPLVFSGYLIRITPDPQQIISSFLFVFLSTWQYWSWIHATSERSHQPGVNGNDYASLLVPISPTNEACVLTEQHTIAACFRSLDDLINAQRYKFDALKAHKQALLQRMFPTEGETLPALRFPAFQDAGVWEYTTLDSLASVARQKEELPRIAMLEDRLFVVRMLDGVSCFWMMLPLSMTRPMRHLQRPKYMQVMYS